PGATAHEAAAAGKRGETARQSRCGGEWGQCAAGDGLTEPAPTGSSPASSGRFPVPLRKIGELGHRTLGNRLDRQRVDGAPGDAVDHVDGCLCALADGVYEGQQRDVIRPAMAVLLGFLVVLLPD